ncbi:MAG: metallophosphoesterase family protein [Chloroflexi bacterium]|nr:MAG: metallophosphoesterase family protein [Chloroflexota bacterium]
MDIYRVGVIADTHVPEALPALPGEIAGLFQGVDLILHAGDINSKEVLDELRLVAPVVAVRGNHDRIDLPGRAVVEVGGKRIGLIHGHRSRWKELPSIISNEVFDGRPFWWGGFQRQILRAFQDVDVIIFGHFHRPYVAWYQNVLLFNPGAVYQLTPEQAKAELGRTFQPLSLIYLLNALRRRPIAPSVGLLTIEDGTIKADILPLTR